MKDSLVLELQKKTIDSSISITDLLRLAYLLSKKLKLSDFEKWITSELNGYKDDEEIPEYRNLSSEIKALNPYRGWIPVLFEDHKMAEYLSSIPMSQPISEIESFATSKDDGFILIKLLYRFRTHNIFVFSDNLSYWHNQEK